MTAHATSRWLLAAAVCALLAAPASAGDPVLSLQPLHPGREVVLEPAFEGEWVYASVSLKLSISRSKNFLTGKPEECYSLVLSGTEEKDTLSFEAHLVRLGSTVFADIQQTSETGLIVLYPHAFAKVRVDRDELHLDFLEQHFVEQALANGRTSLAHVSSDAGPVLTASTRELQTFVESVAFDDDAFDKTVSFTRVKEEDKNPGSLPG